MLRRVNMETPANRRYDLAAGSPPCSEAKNDRFGICDKRGNLVWHGRFFATDHDYNGEQSSGEIAAAKKAVWLASKVEETLGLSAIKHRP